MHRRDDPDTPPAFAELRPLFSFQSDHLILLFQFLHLGHTKAFSRGSAVWSSPYGEGNAKVRAFSFRGRRLLIDALNNSCSRSRQQARVNE